jgi:glycosyltransferase involved in cell wall biosynthesis
VISVVIPAWNAAATLAETLASVGAQTRPVDEIVVVDDGSTDATVAVARAAGARVLRQARQGAAQATNAGIAASRGDLVALLDADDLWTPDKTALQAAALAADPALDGVFGHVACFADAALDGVLRVPAGAQRGWLAGTLLIRRAPLLAVGPFETGLAAGYFIDWADRALRAGLRLPMLPQTVLHRRIRTGSASNRSPLRDADYVRVARAAILRRRAGQPA